MAASPTSFLISGLPPPPDDSGRIGSLRGEIERVVQGERVLGRFTVGERIGGGGHGTVHRAWDERLCRWVAVKSVEGEPGDRVLREAHATARLNHPGIVTLYELGRQNGCAYLVSELVEGSNLRELAARGELSDREVAELGAELCAALAHAHAAGVVHRDLKPDNVLVRRRGRDFGAGRFSRDSGERALLADFGIASVADGPTLTQTGQVVGTLSYMSPEQASGTGAGAPSDVYSLALTLYELWAGFNPVTRATPAATALAIGEPIASLGFERPELPAALCAAIDACLDPDPAQRPELLDLREALVSIRGALHPDRAVPEPLEGAAASTLPPGVPVRPFAVLIGAGVIALLGALAGLPGLAIAAAALLAPAALALSRPSEWLLPVAAPVLGLIGSAPAFLAIAARHDRTAARAALAGLGWAWTAIAGAALGRDLGAGAIQQADVGGWMGSGPLALDGVIAPLIAQNAIATGLIWVGAAVLLGLLLDVTEPAGAAIGGLIWIAGLVAALVTTGATGGILLTPALVVAVGWAIWDRHGRPDFRRWLTGALGRIGVSRSGPERALAPADVPRRPRNPAAAPLADERIRATRRVDRHVRAALHGAGSIPRPPPGSPTPSSRRRGDARRRLAAPGTHPRG